MRNPLHLGLSPEGSRILHNTHGQHPVGFPVQQSYRNSDRNRLRTQVNPLQPLQAPSDIFPVPGMIGHGRPQHAQRAPGMLRLQNLKGAEPLQGLTGSLRVLPGKT